MAPASAFYRTVWRWHFYAGLCVIPLIVILSLSGTLFLFKPQVERWEERAFQGLPTADAVRPSQQMAAARAALPGATLSYYRLPDRPGDAAMIHAVLPDGQARDLFVSPQGRVLGSLDPDARIIAFDRRLHGQLLLDRRGSWIVELGASWAIVLTVTGLTLWWPRRTGLAGVLYPRLTASGRVFWRDLHAVTGFWIAGLMLVLLFTGLPWADAWGNAFKAVRQELGLVKGPQDWTIGGRNPDDGGGHVHAMMPGMAMPMPETGYDDVMFDRMAANARAARLAFPVLVVPPGMPSGEGGSGRPAQDWVVRSDAQDRPLRVTLHYDAQTGTLRSRSDITTMHPIDQIVAYGVAWHEGQLFGGINQAIGVLTALGLIVLSVSGAVMWWRRRPSGTLGAPARPASPAPLRGIGGWALFVFLLAWLPLFTVSLVVVLLFERLVPPRLPRLARWLGIAPRVTPA